MSQVIFFDQLTPEAIKSIRSTGRIQSYAEMNQHLVTYQNEYIYVSTGTCGVHSIERDGSVFSDRYYLATNWKYTDNFFKPHLTYVRDNKITISKRESPPQACMVKYCWSNNYYHFMTEDLPSILHLADTYPNLDIYINATSSFALKTLEIFGVKNRLYYSYPPNDYCIAMSPFISSGNLSRHMLEYILKSRPCPSLTPSIGVLIKREGTNRSLVNHDQVFKTLQQMFPKLTWVEFTNQSPQEQASLFGKAVIIAGPHGAGLINMLYAPDNTTIIEFMPRQEPNVCFWHTAQLMKFKYKCINCDNMTVDCDTLKLIDCESN
jgi:hypothetical protein